MSGHASPPRWAAALLEAVLPRGTSGRSVKGDLDEEFRELAHRRSVGHARRWYGWEAVKIAAHLSWGRVRVALQAAGRRGGADSCATGWSWPRSRSRSCCSRGPRSSVGA